MTWAIYATRPDESMIDGVSLNSIEKRWSKWFQELPEPDENSVKIAKEFIELEEKRRVKLS